MKSSQGALLTPGEAAKKLGVHVKTVGRYCRDGKLSFVKLPYGHRRIYASSVEACRVERGEHESGN